MGETSSPRLLRSLHRRIAFVFDFDETLATRTTDALVRHLGVDLGEFTERVEAMVDDGWEKRLAECHLLVGISRSDRGPITMETFAEVAEGLETYPGADRLLERVGAAVHEIDPEIEVEFHLVTAGFVEIPSRTSLAGQFTSIVGGHWSFDENGSIETPKSTVGHYDKVRHLKRIGKGLDSVGADRSHDIDAHIDEDDWHVPYEQMVFVADGDSDLPSFDFMESNAGTAIAVGQSLDEATWENAEAMRDGRQVLTLLESDYSEGSPLLTALCAAGQRAALWIRILDTADRS